MVKMCSNREPFDYIKINEQVFENRFYLFFREIQRVVAELVASEFFQQGDIEKKQLNIEPIVSKQLINLVLCLYNCFNL